MKAFGDMLLILTNYFIQISGGSCVSNSMLAASE